jgi:hypothetical protein
MRKLFPSARVLTNLYGIFHLLLALGIFIYIVNDASPEKGYTGMGIIWGLLVITAIAALMRSVWGLIAIFLLTLWASYSVGLVIKDFLGPKTWGPFDIIWLPIFSIYEWISTIAILIEVVSKKEKMMKVSND